MLMLMLVWHPSASHIMLFRAEARQRSRKANISIYCSVIIHDINQLHVDNFWHSREKQSMNISAMAIDEHQF